MTKGLYANTVPPKRTVEVLNNSVPYKSIILRKVSHIGSYKGQQTDLSLPLYIYNFLYLFTIGVQTSIPSYSPLRELKIGTRSVQ